MNRPLHTLVAIIAAAAVLLLPAVASSGSRAPEKQKIPLTKPKQIIKLAPPPADAKPEITAKQAIALAVKYSGFKLDESVKARLVTYADTERIYGTRKPMFPHHKPVVAWLVSLPSASFEKKRPEGKTETVKCPLEVGIDADSGRLLGAYGPSAPTWTKGSHGTPDEEAASVFSEAQEPPRLTVRRVLEMHRHRPSPTGQFFVRYVQVKWDHPDVIIRRTERANGFPILPTFTAWVYSRRGVVIRGFSVPPGYTGPPLYATCSDHVLTDLGASGIMGGSY